MILLFIAGTGVQLAMQALESGDFEAAIGALVILAMAALIAWRRLSRKS
jgi:membrane protein implicated in regulation of membrane protease activity